MELQKSAACAADAQRKRMQMKLDQTMLTAIAAACPGNFALYALKEGALRQLYRSAQLPALSGMADADYDALARRDAAELVLPADRAQVRLRSAALSPQQPEGEYTFRICRKAGGAVWVRALARLAGTLDGAPVVAASYRSMGGEAQEFEQLFGSMSMIAYVVEKDSYTLLYANAPAQKAWGGADYSGRPCYEAVAGRKSPCPWCSIPEMKDGCSHCEAAYAPVQDRWFRVDCRAVQWYGRSAIAICAADITDEKRRQEHLELDKESLEMIIRNLPVGVGVCEIRGGAIRTATINERLTGLLGMTAENFAAQDNTLGACIHPEDRMRVLACVKEAAQTHGTLRFEYRFRRPGEAEYRWVRSDVSTLRSGESRMVFLCASDMTQEKRAQEEIQRSRQLYQAVVEEARIVVWEYDIAARRVSMVSNPYAKDGHDRFNMPRVTENVPDSLLQYIAEESVQDFLGVYRAVESGAPRASCDVWYRPQPGQEPRCEHICYITVFDAAGKPVQAYGFGQNITARKLEEQKYIRAYRQLAQARPYTLESFRLSLTQNRCQEIRGEDEAQAAPSSRTADEYFAQLAGQIVSAELREEFDGTFSCAALLRQFQQGQTQFSLTYPMRGEDGMFCWHKLLLFVLQNPASGEVEAVTYTTDVTEQRKNEEVIEHLTSKKFDYVALINLSRRTIEFRNKRERIAFANLQEKADYEAWRGYICASFVPQAAWGDYRAATDPQKVEAELDAAGEYTVSFPLQEKGHITRRQLQYSWLSRERRIALVVRSNITAAYEQEQKQLALVKEALRRAEEASRAKTEFVSRISHDIRTPISIIQSMTRFALEDIDSRAKLQDDLHKIEASSTFLLSLINDVLDISKIDSGKIELQPAPYPYEEYIANITGMFEPLCRQKGLRFTVRREAAARTLCVDQIRLNQITLNLLSNAVKYTPAGGTVTFSTRTRALSGGLLRCEIRVRDTGIGMSEAFQRVMFEPFSQEYDNPGRPKAGSGTGLGLSIVRRIVELIGGTITVRSALGCGTEICVKFTAPEADAPQAQTERQPAAPAPLHGRVLLAEDNEINTAIAARILTDFGLALDTAENGRAAVERFAAAPAGTYRAILMDIQMPLLNGYEAAEAIRALDRPDAASIPIIAMTADAFSAALTRSRAAGMSDYVTKPLDPALLHEVLQRALQQESPRAEAPAAAPEGE